MPNAVVMTGVGAPDVLHWAEAAARVLRELEVKNGETLLLFGGGGSVGVIAAQLAIGRCVSG
ncbi:hypothetical protein [Actinoplanes regularis]|uniref:hypothetical protein n=1 Tax=Actinoplanes regularis TaxID=52697 RepID=UPI0024A1EB2E|nr:hypothetical protein [Actinoplanes regularis]GLW35178.1 hypothetical protein Areg01_81140 [Actinoplanes regularis]